MKDRLWFETFCQKVRLCSDSQCVCAQHDFGRDQQCLLLVFIGCREGAAPMMKGVFGKQAMEDYWDSMAGEQRIRCGM